MPLRMSVTPAASQTRVLAGTGIMAGPGRSLGQGGEQDLGLVLTATPFRQP